MLRERCNDRLKILEFTSIYKALIKEVYEQTRESAITGFTPINLGGWQRLAKVLKQKFSL